MKFLIFCSASISAFSKSSLTIIVSNKGAVANSAEAFATRIFILSSLSVLRFFKRIFNSSILGGFTKMANVSSGNFLFILSPPETSISKITFFPFAQIRSTSVFKVP